MSTSPRRVCIVGPSTYFLSGITYYTFGLCSALSGTFDVSAILVRRLLPRVLYPGRDRVGAAISRLTRPRDVPVFDGVDWFWVPTLIRALCFLIRRRPDVLILQWWTGTVLHTYLVLAAVTRLLGGRVVVEFHEVLDPGEDRLAWAGAYVRLASPWLFRLASGYVVHSEYDRRLVIDRYGLPATGMATIPLASFDQHRTSTAVPRRAAPKMCCNLLYFGVIRPYKGLEDLIEVFDAMPKEEIDRYWLTVVGETWEGWTMPGQMIEQSRYRDRITFVNHYVTDEEVDGFFAGADVVVLPYRRSSQSGPLHVALNYGLPVVVTAVGGLVEAVAGYKGAVLTAPADPAALSCAIRRAASMRGERFPDPRDWSSTVRRYQCLLAVLDGSPPAAPNDEKSSAA